MTTNTTDQLDPLVWTTDEAAHLLTVSRNTIHTMIRRGELPVIRLGRRVTIPKKALAEFVERAGA